MRQAPPEVLSLMGIAARLRASGASWEAVAQEVGRCGRTCRGWADRYPEDWQRLYDEAEEALLKEAGSEALLFLRKTLRSKDEKLSQNTGKFLYQLRHESRLRRGPPTARERSGEWSACLAYLETLSDAEVTAFLADFLARRSAQTGAAVPEGSGPPGAPGPQ